ncbi:MAG: CapA family protein [Candidatus Saccharimonadales bacterium]
MRVVGPETYRVNNYQPPRPKRRWRKPLIFLLTLVGLAGAVWAFRNDSPPPNLSTLIKQNQSSDDSFNYLDGRYLFSGTIVLARAVEKEAGGDYNQPFSGLSTFKPDIYDAWMADLECPVTTNQVSYQAQIANLVFNCRPEWLPTMAKYFKIVNLAGNHTYDMGAEGFPETVSHLKKAGITPIGNYSPRVKEDICKVIALPVKIKSTKDANKAEKARLPVAFCAWHYFSFSPEAGEIEAMKQYANVMPVFAFMHAGTEYLAQAQPNQVDLAHKIINAGPPEFLIGNSPHWVQNTEVYNDKLIVYSTGNFIFDQVDAETMRGASIDAKMSLGYDDNLKKWLALADKCQASSESCLAEAKQQGLRKVKASFTFDAIGNTSGNKRITRKADSTLQAAIDQRLNWAESMRKLGQEGAD